MVTFSCVHISVQRIQYAKTDSEIISKTRGTFGEKEKKKDKKKKTQEQALNAAKKPASVNKCLLLWLKSSLVISWCNISGKRMHLFSWNKTQMFFILGLSSRTHHQREIIYWIYLFINLSVLFLVGICQPTGECSPISAGWCLKH